MPCRLARIITWSALTVDRTDSVMVPDCIGTVYVLRSEQLNSSVKCVEVFAAVCCVCVWRWLGADTAAAASTERQRSVIETQAIVHHSYDDLVDTPPALTTSSTRVNAAEQRHSLSSSTRFSCVLSAVYSSLSSTTCHSQYCCLLPVVILPVRNSMFAFI